ncbi:MAG: hypothetical protein ABJA74_15055 [Lapillicoccus sp.]
MLFESWIAEKVDVPSPSYPVTRFTPACSARSPTLSRARREDSGDLGDLVQLTWAQLHGLASLRINKPSFPWSPMPQLVDQFLVKILS